MNQREIGTDTKSFATALKYVLREDPDIILVGEMRDLETIAAALLSCWGKASALAHNLGAAPAELWQLLSLLPLLLLGMLKAHESSPGDEPKHTESQDHDPDLPAPAQNAPPPAPECSLLAPREEAPHAGREDYTKVGPPGARPRPALAARPARSSTG